MKECSEAQKQGEWVDNPRDRMKKLRLCQVKYRSAYSGKGSKDGLIPELSATKEARMLALGS